MNRKTRQEMWRMYMTARGSQTGWHVSVYNVISFVERHGLKPPFTFELSPINYDKLWRQQKRESCIIYTRKRRHKTKKKV